MKHGYYGWFGPCLLILAIPASAYEIRTHIDLSRSAAQKAEVTSTAGARRLGLGGDQKFPLLPHARNDETAPCDDGAVYGIVDLIRCGAAFEDVPGTRSLNHFFNPKNTQVNDGALIALGIVQGASSAQWALATTGAYGENQKNSFDDARGYFLKALTITDSAERRKNWGATFQSLGQVIHHIQDMAQPQHVRNDPHCDHPLCALIGQSPSLFEFHARDTVPGQVRSLAQNSQAVYPLYGDKFTTPRSFWVGGGSGIAEYTNSNFVSAGTNFRMSEGVAAGNISLPQPVPNPMPSRESVAQVFGAEPIPAGIAYVCNNDVQNCKFDFYATTVTDPLANTTKENKRASTYSLFDAALQEAGGTVKSIDPPTGLTYSTERVFTLNRYNFDSTLPLLIPQAVGYSAGLINYFFRGRMKITLPDQGVYGIVDHAVAAGNSPQTGGFGKLKLKVQNLTPSATDPSGIERMDTAGKIWAVAKFHRNNCYTANLSGEYAVAPGGWEQCRSSEEENVVSSQAGVPESIDSGPSEVTFIFPTPIPISATDLFLQVVYSGSLGGESNAVVVETKDISEPTYLYNYTRLDQFTFAPYPSLDSGPYTYTEWCGQGPYASVTACNEARGMTHKWQFSPTTVWLPNYDPSSNPVPQDTIVDKSQELPSTPIVTMTAPVGQINRIAVLLDTPNIDKSLWIEEQIDTTQGWSTFHWKSDVLAPFIVQLDSTTNTLIPSVSYVCARGVCLPSWENGLLNSGSAPDLQLTPANISF